MESHPELVALAVLATILAVLIASTRAGVPYPVLLVLGGLALGAIPGMPRLRLEPQVVFLGVLPPLLFWPAFQSSVAELRTHARAIGTLAVALVLVTTAGV